MTMNNGMDAEVILMDTLMDNAAKLLRDANRWRKLEMLMDHMIEHEPRWFVYGNVFADNFSSVEELNEAIDKVDVIVGAS